MSELKEKDLGAVVTPQKTAKYIISKLGKIESNQKILDPCVGPGVFIKTLIDVGVNESQIYAYDINPNYKEPIKQLGIKFELCDTLLNINDKSLNEFDFIIGNPPYLNKSSSYVRKNKSKLKRIYGHVNAHETYSMFIVNSIWRLKEAGKLGFITSDTFLTLITHKKLRKFLLENTKLNEILLAPKDLFSKQGVSTNPVIIILTKCTGNHNKVNREKNIINIVPRLRYESEYWNPPLNFALKQKKYHILPFNIFFIDIENQVIELFKKSPKLKQFIKGYIGMHTHDNKRFIAAIQGTDLADIFNKRNKKILELDNKYKIISRDELNSGNWKPYLKRGGSDQYYRPIMEALKWDKTAISNYDIPNNIPFEQEGIVVSGISTKLAARYMPKGCYWDSNKAIGFIIENDSFSIFYILGLLNSSLYNYLAKGIINNTSSIQISGIHALPIIIPDVNTKSKVELLVSKIIQNKKHNLSFDYKSIQKEIDNLIYKLYNNRFKFPPELKKKLDRKYSIYS
ncbi:MAG: Eco57I restriction-modification methylase domain-containing protein [Candidatus Heimdallarchaeota archaeon]